MSKIDFTQSYLLQNFQSYNRTLSEKVVRYKEIDPFDLMIETEDGSIYTYYMLDNTTRFIRKGNDMSKEEFVKEFIIRIHRIMQVQGINQKELAKRTGLSEIIISRCVTGKHIPGAHIFYKILRALNCSLDDITYEF